MTEELPHEKAVIIKTDDIIANDWNPNEMSQEKFQALVETFQGRQKMGNVRQPIIVRPHASWAGKYEIIDGEHRYKAMVQAGFKEIFAVVRGYDDKEARMQTLGMDKIHGEFSKTKLLQLVTELHEDFQMQPEELMTLGISEADIEAFKVEPEEPTPISEEAKDYHICFTVSAEQRMLLQTVADTFNLPMEEGIMALAKYLTIVAKPPFSA